MTRREIQSKYYHGNKDKFRQHSKERRAVIRSRMQDFKTTIGCQNPECAWKGTFKPFMLEFHHVDATEKRFNIAERTTFKALRMEIPK